jgi:hypothetical protein
MPADGVTLPGTGEVVATDYVGSQQYQRVKIGIGADGAAVDWNGENHLGAIGGNTVEIIVTPTLTVYATYVANDFVGTSTAPMDFTPAARINAGSGTIIGATLVDYALQSIACELWLFSATVTPPADSAAWSISDADALKCIGVIPFSTYYASALNSISVGAIPNGQLPFVTAGGDQSIFGCLVTRGAPAYASGDISVRLVIAQD